MKGKKGKTIGEESIVILRGVRGMQLRFSYKGFDVKEYIGEPPHLVIRVNIKNESEEHVFIPRICFDITLIASAARMESNREVGKFGRFEGLEPLFVKPHGDVNTECHIPLSGQRIEEMIKIRSNNEFVSLEIIAEGIVLAYESENGERIKRIKEIQGLQEHVHKFSPEGEENLFITFWTEEFKDLLEKVKYIDILSIEIPVPKDRKNADEKIIEALKCLEEAKDCIIRGDYPAALISIRNAINNHLTKVDKEKKKRVLSEDIKERFLERMPTDARSIYKQIAEALEDCLRTISSDILSKFIHKDGTLRLSPLREDVEQIYFTVLSITKRLGQVIMS